MKTHCTAFLGLLPTFSSHNTLKPAGLPKPRVFRCREAIKQSIANAQFDSFSLVWYILAQYIIPYFKADISSVPKVDRLTQICLYKFFFWVSSLISLYLALLTCIIKQSVAGFPMVTAFKTQVYL